MVVPGSPSTAGGQPDAPEQKAVFEALAGKAAAEVHGNGPMPGSRFEQVLVGSIALAALALCTYNVIVRYFLPALVVEWSDEVQVYLVIWAIFLSLGLVTAADRHVKADLFVSMFSAITQRRLLLLADVLGLGFSIFLVIYGSLVTWETYDFGDVSITSLRFPLWIYAAALPVGGLLMAVRYLMRLAGLLRKGA
jgi:TRAP-type C4-dicarboxylate transport system permease small subunit